MKNESDTPLCDGAAFYGRDMGNDKGPPHFECVDADFARTLERRCKVLEEELNDFFAKNSETHSGRAQILERRCKRLREYLEWVAEGKVPHLIYAVAKKALEEDTALADQKEEKI